MPLNTRRYETAELPHAGSRLALAHVRGAISPAEYLDRTLAHWTGTRHPEDVPNKKLLFDGFSMALYSSLRYKARGGQQSPREANGFKISVLSKSFFWTAGMALWMM